MSEKGYALRVSSEVLVPPNATEADYDAAWAMMTPDERVRVGKQIVRDLKWTIWCMKHPNWAAFLDGACQCGLAMLGYR